MHQPLFIQSRFSGIDLLCYQQVLCGARFKNAPRQLEAVIQTGAEFGMQSMDRTLVNLIHAGTITYDEARNYAIDLDELDRLMRG